jgi:hypothetical protein
MDRENVAETKMYKYADIDLGITALFGYIEARSPGTIFPFAIDAGCLIEGRINVLKGVSNSRSAADAYGSLMQYDLSLSPSAQPVLFDFEQPETS